eukprot:1158529-Pelagomonas_calceolata.AAC.13
MDLSDIQVMDWLNGWEMMVLFSMEEAPLGTFDWTFMSNPAQSGCAGGCPRCGLESRQNPCQDEVLRKLPPGLADQQHW